MMLLAASPALVLLEVGLGLSVILGVLWMLGRRLNGASGSGSQRVIRLTAQDSVHVVEVDGKRLLVGTGAGGPPRLLCELEASLAGGAGTAADAQAVMHGT